MTSENTVQDKVSVSTRDEEVIFSENQEAKRDDCNSANNIPSRNYKKYLSAKYRNLHMACGILLIIILIIIITIALTKNNGQIMNDSKVLSDYRGHLFLIINGTALMKFNHSTNNSDLVFATSNLNCIGIDVDQDDDIYYTDAKATWFINHGDKNAEVILEEKRFKPGGLALDRITGNIYIVDKTAGNLVVLNSHNGNYAILLTDLISPHAVVLDSEEGLLFIMQHSHSIIRAKMDGLESEDIVLDDKITSLTIDSSRKRLYWISDFIKIKSSNYDGDAEQTFFSDTVKIASITILDNHLLWIRSTHQQSANCLLSCEIGVNDICSKRATHRINATGNITTILGYSTFTELIPDPCKVKNGDCEHLCLPNGRNNRSCACRMGWQLNADDRTCEEVRDFVLYPYDGVVRTCTLDGKRELFWPTPYSVNKLTVKTEIDFDYDLKNDYFYFTDDHNIHRMKLKSYSDQEVILSVQSTDMIIDDIAYDWFTGNIYYGQRHVNATLEHSLVVFNTRLGESYRKSIKIFDRDNMKARSYALALHPASGYLFVAVTHEDEGDTHVFRKKVDGSDYRRSFHFYAEHIQDHRFFAIDYESDRIYAIQETGEKIWIVYVKIESTGMQFSEHPNIVNARTVAVHQRWLYLSNYSSIYRFDKETGEEQLMIAPRIENPAKKIIGVRIASEEVQSTGADNPCAKNNGGCEQFCFSGSKATCNCKDGQTVTENGRCYKID